MACLLMTFGSPNLDADNSRPKGTDQSGYPPLPQKLEQGSSPGTLSSAVSLGFKLLQGFLRKQYSAAYFNPFCCGGTGRTGLVQARLCKASSFSARASVGLYLAVLGSASTSCHPGQRRSGGQSLPWSSVPRFRPDP